VRRAAPLLLLLAVAAGCTKSPAAAPQALRVGTSGDYAPFSSLARDGEGLEGFDLTIAGAFARDVGLELGFERFAWPGLSGDVAAGRFDVAMSGVTVRPERSVIGRFSVPVARSGAVVLVSLAHAMGGLDGLDRPEVRIAVNAGGHLERAARRRFPRASLRPSSENDAVRRALLRGEVDAVVTDTLEVRHWQPSLPGAVRLGPFTHDRKAYLWSVATDPKGGGPAGRAEQLDAWLLAREADGSLARWRERWLGAPGPPTATPLAALVAALGERLSLMPAVAEAKRASGLAVRDRAREAQVLDSAFAGVERHAAAVGSASPPRVRVDAFYRAQIEAAVAIQEGVLARPASGERRFDLASELRPALLRLGDRIAWALVRLDAVPQRDELVRAVAAELAPYALESTHRDALADAIGALAQRRASARANSPAITGNASEAP
jgi:cyclohexadienyl dehydratase